LTFPLLQLILNLTKKNNHNQGKTKMGCPELTLLQRFTFLRNPQKKSNFCSEHIPTTLSNKKSAPAYSRFQMFLLHFFSVPQLP
jgi:hypothetical protein